MAQFCPAFVHKLLTQQPPFEQLLAEGQQRPPALPQATQTPAALQTVLSAEQTLPLQQT